MIKGNRVAQYAERETDERRWKRREWEDEKSTVLSLVGADFHAKDSTLLPFADSFFLSFSSLFTTDQRSPEHWPHFEAERPSCVRRYLHFAIYKKYNHFNEFRAVEILCRKSKRTVNIIANYTIELAWWSFTLKFPRLIFDPSCPIYN